jgi:hypothetical protein
MIGLSIENAAVMTNWMPTIAHKVRCHCVAALPSAAAPLGCCIALPRSRAMRSLALSGFVHPPDKYRKQHRLSPITSG